MIRRCAAAAILFALLTGLLQMFGTRVASAQDAPLSLDLGPGSSYPDIELLLTAPGEFGAELTSADVVLRDGASPAPVTVTKVGGNDVEVVVAVDTSGSMVGAPIAAARDAASAFVARVPLGARVAVVGFGDRAYVAVPMTTDRTALVAGIARLDATGETALFDAVELALAQFSTTAGVRRQVVLLSDGNDTASSSSVGDVSARLLASGARLDTVALQTNESDDRSLQLLTRSGRGSLTPIADASGLARVYDALGQTVANQYRLTYRSAGAGPTVVEVDVTRRGERRTVRLSIDHPPAATTSIVPPPTVLSAAADATSVGSARPASRAMGWALAAGAVAWFVALVVAGLLIAAPSQRNLLATSLRNRSTVDHGVVSGAGERLASIADQVLERRGQRSRLNAALDRAGLELRPGEFAAIVLVLSVVAVLLGVLFLGVVGAAASAVPPLVAALVLSLRTSARRRAFTAQLGDALQTMSNALRTGYAVTQAMNVVATEAASPIRDEFRRVLVEVRLGRDLRDSLQAMADRVGGDDVRWVVQAMEINREVGGDLAEVLDNVALTIREREQLRRQISAVSAEGRLSAYVLVALPIALAGLLAVLNPGYFDALTRGIGLVLVLASAVMLVVGSIVLNRLVKIEL